MNYEPLEKELDEYMGSLQSDDDIDSTKTSPQWSRWRDEIAQEMWNNRRTKRRVV